MTFLRVIFLAALAAAQAVAQSSNDGNEVFFPRATAEAPAEDALLPEDPGSTASTFVMFAGYGVVLVALGVGIYFVLRRGGWRRVMNRSEGRLQVRETRMLGNRQFLMVVEYETSRLLVGVSPGRIELLTPLGPPESNLEAMPEGLMVGAKGG